MQGIKAAADRLLQTTHHPRRNPNGVSALVGPGAVAALAQHLHLQLTGRRRKAAAAHADRARRQAGKHVHTKQGCHAVHGAIGLHPGRPLGRFLSGLKQQPHPGREQLGVALGKLRQQVSHPQPHGGVQVVAAGVHQALLGGGVVEAGTLLHRQGIHIHPQGHQGGGQAIKPLLWPQLRQHAGAADTLAHLPTPAPQLTCHQGSCLLLMATELGMAMDMTPQLDQLRQHRGQGLLKPQGLPIQAAGCCRHSRAIVQGAKARNCARASTGSGGQRRVASNHSRCR